MTEIDNLKINYNRKKKEAASRGKEFTLTFEQYKHLLSQTVCDYTGVDFAQSKETKSIERVDNDLGYIPGNVIVVTRRANMLKSDLYPDELLTKSAFKRAATRLHHTFNCIGRVEQMSAERKTLVWEAEKEFKQLRKLLLAPQIIDADHIDQMVMRINRYTGVQSKIQMLDESIKRSTDHIMTLEKIKHSIEDTYVIAKIHEAIITGEAQRKANAYFGIKEKPLVIQRLLKVFRRVKRSLLNKQDFIEVNVSTNSHEV